MSKFCKEMGSVILGAALISVLPARAEEAKTTLAVSAPLSRQVFQRDAEEQAVLTIRGTVNDQVDSIEAKAELVQGGNTRQRDRLDTHCRQRSDRRGSLHWQTAAACRRVVQDHSTGKKRNASRGGCVYRQSGRW